FLEVMSYRRKGHAEHDSQSYQPADEIERWATTNDPIDRFVERIEGEGWVRRDERVATDAEVESTLDAAVAAAEASPMPEAADALTDVYAGGPVSPPWTRFDPPDPSRA